MRFTVLYGGRLLVSANHNTDDDDDNLVFI